MDLPKEPLFAFGQGLSYTTFEYGPMEVGEDTLKVSVEVTNTGSRDGFEIVQLYFKDRVSSVMTPVKQLIGFEKVFIPAKEKRTVTFTLEREAFSFVTRNEKRVIEPGEIELMIGKSSLDEELQKKIIRI